MERKKGDAQWSRGRQISVQYIVVMKVDKGALE